MKHATVHMHDDIAGVTSPLYHNLFTPFFPNHCYQIQQKSKETKNGIHHAQKHGNHPDFSLKLLVHTAAFSA